MKAGQAFSVIHIENAYASGQQKRPRGPRSNPVEEIVALMGNSDPAPQRAFVDLKQVAVTYYVHCHLQTLTDTHNISKSFSNDIAPVWASRVDCPIMDLAVSSMALAVFSRTQQHPPAAIEAAMTYQKLLHMAQKTILSLNEGNADAYLLAIFFMSRYEDTVYGSSRLAPENRFATTIQSFSHHDGALATLKIWKHRLSKKKPASDVIKHTRRGMIRSALMRNLALPNWIVDGSCFGEQGLELEYDDIVIQIANVRHRLSLLLEKTIDTQPRSYDVTTVAEDLNQEAELLDQALQNWTTHFPDDWRYQRHSLPKSCPWPSQDFYSSTIFSYSSLAYAAVWNQYHATRMLINGTRLKALKLASPSTDERASEQRLECLYNIRIMANDLASSVPYSLNRFSLAEDPSPLSSGTIVVPHTNEDIKPYVADLTVWPLSIASSLGDLDPKQKAWFRCQLARLGRVIGAGILECAETDEWLDGSIFGVEKFASIAEKSRDSSIIL